MRRRDFIGLVGGAAAWPLAARAQPSGSRPRIGILMGYSETDPSAQKYLAGFTKALAEAGWRDGAGVKIEVRWAAGDPDRIRRMANEVVQAKPDLIFANTTPVTAALVAQTRSIPIVFGIVSDPVGAGFVESLSRPGGNVTGFVNLEDAMGGKWLTLLSEAAPLLDRVALLFNPDTAPGKGRYFLPSFEEAARALNVTPIVASFRDPADIEPIIASVAKGSSGGGLVVSTDVSTLVHRKSIASAAARHKLPVIVPSTGYIREAGFLLSYGSDNVDTFARAAGYIDRILRGARPSDLPVQVPIKFELAVNLRTAKALGLDIPAALMARADEVIE